MSSSAPGIDLSQADRPLVVELRSGDEASARFTALRRMHFPADRTWLDAHVTHYEGGPWRPAAAVMFRGAR